MLTIAQVRARRDQLKKENFAAWGVRHGLGPIWPVPPNDFDLFPTGPDNYLDDDYVLDALWDIPNR